MKKVSDIGKDNIAKIQQFGSIIRFIIIVVFLILLVEKYIVFLVSAPDTSMQPSLTNDDKGVVSVAYNPNDLKRGDIVIFHSDECDKLFLRRLIGMPGDIVTIRDGVTFINDVKLEEDYVKYNDEFNGTFTVPEGRYFFLSDNRTDINDSRYWTNPYIDVKDLKGKLQFIFYPFKDFGAIEQN